MKGHLYWSVRRELWEHRAVLFGPLIVAGLVLVAFLLSAIHNVPKLKLVMQLDAVKQAVAISMPFNFAAAVVLFTSFLVAAFYCLDAMNSERRDRSILFWKSLPVSDRTTVLAKAIVALGIQPVVGLVTAFATQAALLVMAAFYFVANGVDVSMLWTRLFIFEIAVVMLYGVAVHALWYAPLYAYLLLVSALAKRGPFLWAVLPVAVATLIERFAFGTRHLAEFVNYRMGGAMKEAFINVANKEFASLADLAPAKFLASPGLWLGLAVAVVFLLVAIRLRRSREPI